MSLVDLQRGLAWTLLRAASPAHVDVQLDRCLRELPLDPNERAWLQQLPAAHGFQVTCFIQRWWRETKLRSTLRLTLQALGPRCAEVMSQYLDSVACGSLFYLPEALTFLDFVQARAQGGPHLCEVAAFERAYLLCQEARRDLPIAVEPADDVLVERAPAAAVIHFAAAPLELMSALLARAPLPPVGEVRAAVLVAPGLPHLWRLARPAEVTVLERWTHARRWSTGSKGQRRLWRRLLASGALRPSQG